MTNKRNHLKSLGKPVSYRLLFGLLGLNLSSWLAVYLFSSSDLGFPVVSYLIADNNAFNDFYFDRIENPAAYFPHDPAFGNSPPLATLLGFIYGLFPPVTGLVIFVTGSTILTAVCHGLISRNAILLMVTFTSFPYWFAVSRANNDLLLLPLLLVFLYLFRNGHLKSASAFLAVVVGIEPIFGGLLAVLLAKRVLANLFSFIFASIPIWGLPLFIGPKDLTSYYTGFLQALNSYREWYVIGDAGLLFSNSLWSPVKTLLALSSGFEAQELNSLLSATYPFYSVLLPTILLLGLMLFKFKHVDDILSFSIILIAILLFGPVTATYKLTVLSILCVLHAEHPWRFSHYVVWGCSIAQVSKSFPTIELPHGSLVTADSIVNPFVLLGMLVLIIVESISSVKAEQKSGKDPQDLEPSACGPLKPLRRLFLGNSISGPSRK